MSKTNKNTGVAVITEGTSSIDAVTLIKRELDALKEITGSEFKTGGNGTVTGFPRSVQEEKDIPTLVKMYSSVTGKAAAYDAACAEISQAFPGFKAPVFKENGATPAALKADIILALKILSVKERKEFLEGLMKEAQEFISRDDKFKMFKAKLENSLGETPTALLQEGAE